MKGTSCDVREHGSCHEMCWQTQAFYAMKLLCSGTR